MSRTATSLLDLPEELVLEILNASNQTPEAVNALAQTCKALFYLANPVLYTSSLARWDPVALYEPLRYAATEDRIECIRRALAYHNNPEIPFSLSDIDMETSLNISLYFGSFHVAMTLLKAGANITQGVPALELQSLDSEVRTWIKEEREARWECDLQASLVHAAECSFAEPRIQEHWGTEREFWRWKKKTMLAILCRGQRGSWAAHRGGQQPAVRPGQRRRGRIQGGPC